MKSWRKLAAVVLMLFVLPAGAQIADTVPAPQISLITFAPGQIYWQRYGHNALLIREANSAPLLFNYGIFDFRQKNFFLNFARGQMLYRLAAQPLDQALEIYRDEGRWVREQKLNLTAQQASALRDYLYWNVQPENAEYRYDYFRSNCSTRVRDMLDQVLDGALRRQLEAQASGRDYRYEGVRHMASAPGLMLGVDALLGPQTDLPITLWQQSFLPLTLMRGVAQHRLSDGVALVEDEQWLLQGSSADVPERPPSLLLSMLFAGLIVAALLLLARGIAFSVLVLPLTLISGMGGVILLLAWTLTDHWAIYANRNLLLFNPLSLLLLPAAMGRTSRYASGLAWFIALGAALALLLLLLPAAQQNLHWIALWLPVHVAIAWRLRSVHRSV